MSRACPAGECCAAEELGVVRMGEDDEDVLGEGPVIGESHVWRLKQVEGWNEAQRPIYKIRSTA